METILLDENLNIKIWGFVLARNNANGIDRDVGSEHYRAPEICRRDFNFDGEKADVFALAVVLFACGMKRFPTSRIFNVTDSREY
jgi:serine/threonine protein kinase